MNKKSGVFSPLLLLAAFISRATVVYVDSSNTNANQNGASWTTAFSGFQNAINAAASGDTLWVARGTYSPPSGGSFTMKEGVRSLAVSGIPTVISINVTGRRIPLT